MPLHPGSIGETFVRPMANCITSFSLGDGLESHFQAIFGIFPTIFFRKFGAAAVDLGLQAISEAFLAGKRTNYFQR